MDVRRSGVALASALLALGACEAAPDGRDVPKNDPSTFQVGDGVWLNPDATYVPFDPGRKLNLVERALMRAPGPLSGRDYELNAVVKAVMDEEPESPAAWAEAILAQIHPNYVSNAKKVITFKARLDVPATPTEKLEGVEVVGKNHFAIVLDASGSMREPAGSGETRMDAAKDAIADFAGTLPDDSIVTLRIYGHAGSGADKDKQASCSTTEQVYTGPPSGLGQAVDKVEPTGWTPLARAIEETEKDIPDEASDSVAYVVTDGLESCGGDPVPATKKLAASGVKPIINVIGFQVGDADADQLRQIARAGGGSYTDVRSGDELANYWREDLEAMKQAWSDWKDDALRKISAQGEANMQRAKQPGEAVMEAVERQEWGRAQEVHEALDEADAYPDYDTEHGTWRRLYKRKSAIWRWAYYNKSANWREAYDQKSAAWRQAYDLGSDQWTEYYRKGIDAR